MKPLKLAYIKCNPVEGVFFICEMILYGRRKDINKNAFIEI